MSPEQEILNILLQGEMEMAMKRVMSFELYNEAVRMYRDNIGWTVAHTKPDQLPELYSYTVANEALDKFDMIAEFIRLRVQPHPPLDQKNS